MISKRTYVWRGLLLAVLLSMTGAAPTLSQPPASSTHSAATASRPTKVRARALATALVYASVMFLAMFVGILAILRFTRRFRAAVLKPVQKPTNSSDAWSMHKPPAELPPDDDIAPPSPMP